MRAYGVHIPRVFEGSATLFLVFGRPVISSSCRPLLEEDRASLDDGFMGHFFQVGHKYRRVIICRDIISMHKRHQQAMA
jgi:hypothetical protein